MSVKSIVRVMAVNVMVGFLTIMVLCLSLAVVAHAADGPRVLEGKVRGVAYKVVVPENWNKILLVYAHGYRSQAELIPVVSPESEVGRLAGVENILLSRGYALAGTSYRRGWAVKDAILDNFALVQTFKRKVGKPQKVILYGFSLGGTVALKIAEDYPKGYDGVIGGCVTGAGATKTWDRMLDMAIAYDAVYGWPASWGKIGDVKNSLNYNADVSPLLPLFPLSWADYLKTDFIRVMGKVPLEQYDRIRDQGVIRPGLFYTYMMYITAGRAELEKRAGGPMVQNLGRHYVMDDDVKSYFTERGMDPEELLAKMNAHDIIKPSKRARTFLEKNGNFTGKIKIPVITIHTTIDGLAPLEHESAYRKTVEEAGASGMLAQAFARYTGHCAFDPDQLVSAIIAMESWLVEGKYPDKESFPEEQGFADEDNGFELPPWLSE